MSLDHQDIATSSLNRMELEVFNALSMIKEPSKYLKASHFKRLRVQQGMKEEIQEGIKESGRYLPYMEAIFIRKGLPFELTRIPFVESSFNTKVRSKVGASGVWQFIKATGKNYLRIDDLIDERNDPIRAAEAAAELLKTNYETLGSWPLAVTAYNHGRMGLFKASRRLGTNSLEKIIEDNRARNFGFASKNYYASIIAALEVEQNYQKYFGSMDRLRAENFLEWVLPQSITLKDLCAFLKLKKSELIHLNPSWDDSITHGFARIPKATSIRIKDLSSGSEESQNSQKRILDSAFSKIPRIFKSN